MNEQQQNVVVEVLSKQLQQKRAPGAPAAGPMAQAPSHGAERSGGSARSVRPSTDTLLSWNALPNEWIVPLGKANAVPLLGGSVGKLLARGVVRFPSSVMRIEFSTDNISSENQGVLVQGWACWRVADPKIAVSKLDLSDPDSPMLNTSRTLAVECAGIMKGLISVKTVQDLLKRREDLIDRLREKLKPTEARWGISFDEIGISEVQILSQEVFENLQRPFRNEAREVAATSDLDTEERIASKTGVQKERVARLNAENANKLRELQTRNETLVRGIEIAEEKKRLLGEQEVKGLRIEEEKLVQLNKEKARREVEEQRISSEHAFARAKVLADQETRLQQLRSENERALEAARLEAARKGEEESAQAALREQNERRELARLVLAREIAEAEQALARARKEAEIALQRIACLAEVEEARTRHALAQEEETFRLKVTAEERRILGLVSDAEIRAKVAEALPEIASKIRIGDVRWYGGNGAGESPLGILPRALEQVLEVAEAHGIDLRRRANGAGTPAADATSGAG